MANDEVKIGQAQTVFGVLWYVKTNDEDPRWFSTEALAVAYAARLRYSLMTGEEILG